MNYLAFFSLVSLVFAGVCLADMLLPSLGDLLLVLPGVLDLPGDLGTGLAAGDHDPDLPSPSVHVFLLITSLLGGDGDGAEDLSSSLLMHTKILGVAPEDPSRGNGDDWEAAAALALALLCLAVTLKQ